MDGRNYHQTAGAPSGEQEQANAEVNGRNQHRLTVRTCSECARLSGWGVCRFTLAGRAASGPEQFSGPHPPLLANRRRLTYFDGYALRASIAVDGEFEPVPHSFPI